jgi:hypothetical protein
MLSAVTVVGMSNSLLMVLVNYASPDRRALGAVNGISTAVGVSSAILMRTCCKALADEQCMARVVGPSLASAVSHTPSLWASHNSRVAPPDNR